MGGMPHGAMPRGGTPVGAAPADADVAFIEMMIPHHQGAVAMSREILETTKRPELQQLARNIIRNQEREIAQTRLVVRECPCNVGRNGRRHVGGDAEQSGRCWRAICSEAAFPNRRLAPRTSCIRGAASLPSTLVRRATAVHHGDRRLERSASVVRSLTVRVESLATFRNPPPTFVPPPDHARCSVPPSLSRPTSCLPPPASGPP